MNDTVLLKKLIDIERSIGIESNNAIRNLVHDAQAYLLEMQKEKAEKFLATAWRDLAPEANWLRKVS